MATGTFFHPLLGGEKPWERGWRRTHAHLVQGTRPSKKLANITDVKPYLQVASVEDDGLLVVRRHEPLSPSRECIILLHI